MTNSKCLREKTDGWAREKRQDSWTRERPSDWTSEKRQMIGQERKKQPQMIGQKRKMSNSMGKKKKEKRKDTTVDKTKEGEEWTGRRKERPDRREDMAEG